MKTRTNKRGGGVGIFIKENYKFVVNETMNKLDLKKTEIIAVDINLENKLGTKITIIVIYKPPEVDLKTTLDDLDKILSATCNKKAIICGDMNIDLSNRNKQTELYTEKLQEYNMIQTVNAYTRITAKTNTIIDHNITNLNDLITIVTHHQISDHQIVISTWGKKGLTKPQKEQKNTANKNQIHYEKSSNEIRNINWEAWVNENENKDLETIYKSFNKTIQSCLIYQKMSKKNTPKMPYITKELLKERNEVQKRRKIFIKKRTERHEQEYKNLKKEYNKNLRISKNNYFTEQIKRAGKDSKKVWSIINNILNRNKKTEPIKEITHNDQPITDNLEIANTFNNFYKHVAYQKLKNSTTGDKHDFKTFLDPNDKRTNTFTFKNISKFKTWTYSY